jgi:hypothetical protein
MNESNGNGEDRIVKWTSSILIPVVVLLVSIGWGLFSVTSLITGSVDKVRVEQAVSAATHSLILQRQTEIEKQLRELEKQRNNRAP